MSIDAVVTILGAHPFLAAVPQEGLRILAFMAERKRYSAGTVLFGKGALTDGALLLVSGSVALDANDGKAAIELRPGALIGELAMLMETERPATATALSDVDVIVILRAVFRRVVEEYPEATVAIQRMLASRVAAASAELEVVHDIVMRGLEETEATEA
jgi:CRP-like cAMP-binding protein